MITAEKLPNSAPIRAGTAPLAGARFKILADLRFKLTFELFIGFKLHTIHTSKIVPVMLSVSVVVAHNSPIIQRTRQINERERISKQCSRMRIIDLNSDYYAPFATFGVEHVTNRSRRIDRGGV